VWQRPSPARRTQSQEYKISAPLCQNTKPLIKAYPWQPNRHTIGANQGPYSCAHGPFKVGLSHRTVTGPKKRGPSHGTQLVRSQSQQCQTQEPEVQDLHLHPVHPFAVKWGCLKSSDRPGAGRSPGFGPQLPETRFMVSDAAKWFIRIYLDIFFYCINLSFYNSLAFR